MMKRRTLLTTGTAAYGPVAGRQDAHVSLQACITPAAGMPWAGSLPLRAR